MKLSALRTPVICAMLAAFVLAFSGCAKRPQPAPESVAALLKERPPGPQVAMDYDKVGHPSLTDAERATIQDTLAKVELCQRPLVRYVFGGDDGIEMFFAAPGPSSISHIFGEGNLWYSAEAKGAIVLPPDFGNLDSKQSMAEGVKYDVQRQPCPK